MEISFERVSAYPRGTLSALLSDAYSFDSRCARHWAADWRDFDDFFFDRPDIADRYGFITALGGEAIGFASWDPRNMPGYAQIGHNCIACAHKGNGYGKAQLAEAVRRIVSLGAKKILVTSNAGLVPAQRMYLSVGFTPLRRRINEETPFSGEYIDYEYLPERGVSHDGSV